MSRVTQVALGALAGAAGLDTATPAGRFRRSLRLAIPTGGGAQGADLGASPVLDVTFLAREVDARAPGAPEPATLAVGGAGLVLSLPVAREIARVRLAAPQAGDQIAAFRFEGAAVSDDPVVAAAHGGAGAVLGVVDRALILRRRNAGDHALTASAIAAVVLRHPPVNPRILIAVGGDPAGEQALPPATGAGGQPVFPASMSSGAALAAALGPALGRLADQGTLPDPLQLDLVLEADQPCAARIDALDIALTLERRGFAGAGGKRVLRFRGEGREMQAVALALPPAAQTLAGTMRYCVSGTALRARAAPGTGTAPEAQADGVALAGDEIVACRIDLPGAAVVVGAEVVLAATEPRTTLVARLHADREGRPGADLGAGGEVALDAARPHVVAVAFPATTVPAGPVWLALSAPRGAAVAMLGEGEGQAARGRAPDLAPLGPSTGGLAAVLRFAAPAAEASRADVELRMGDVILPAAGGVADLGPALAALPEPRPAEVILSVGAGSGAVVTLDPPVLRYTLGS